MLNSELEIPSFLIKKKGGNLTEWAPKKARRRKIPYKKNFIKNLPKLWAKANVTMVNIYWATRGDCGYRMVAYRTITKGRYKGKIAYRSNTNNSTFYVIPEVFYKFKQEEVTL